MYSMPSERITSTMKSEPGRPLTGLASFGVSVSIAIFRADGRRTAGILAASIGGVMALAASCGAATVLAAPATATPDRNLRRLTCERESFRAIAYLPHGRAGLRHRGRRDSIVSTGFSS